MGTCRANSSRCAAIISGGELYAVGEATRGNAGVPIAVTAADSGGDGICVAVASGFHCAPKLYVKYVTRKKIKTLKKAN
jgi:hypothetical protein